MFILNNVDGQSIPSFWSDKWNLEIPYLVRNQQPKKITLSNKVIYSYSSVSTSKVIYYFDSKTHFMCEKFEDDVLIEVDSFVIDNLYRVVYFSTDRYYPLFGWKKSITRSIYNDRHNIIDSIFGNDGLLQRIVKYEYNDREYLNRIDMFNSMNERTSYETADYDYSNGSYMYKAYNSNNDLVLSRKELCSMDTTMDVKNSFGDYVKIIWHSSIPKKVVSHELVYKYDKYGNWIDCKRYVVVGKDKSLNTIKKREIEYQKTN